MSAVYLKSLLAAFITSPAKRSAVRRASEAVRRIRGKPHVVHYFHRVDDPYSHLMVQILPLFLQRYEVRLVPHVITRLDPDMYPEEEMLKSYAIRDCVELARRYGLSFPGGEAGKNEGSSEVTAARLALDTSEPDFLQKAHETGEAFWSNSLIPDNQCASEQGIDRLRAAEQLLARKGHYLSATLLYGGEWYWGLDRLHYLEERLSGLRVGNPSAAPLLNPVKQNQTRSTTRNLKQLSYYFSARSPYSYIGYFKARKFAADNDIDLNLKPVLPMMMRNMKVPSAKRLYILKDAKREAEKAGLPFGRIADPLGKGVERIYAVAYQAGKSGQQAAFFNAALPAVFARGIDLATNRGLRQVCDEAGLSWEQCEEALENRDWEKWVENNRLDMVATGCWGVPTLQYGKVSAWGQDRFWLIEDAVRSHLP